MLIHMALLRVRFKLSALFIPQDLVLLLTVLRFLLCTSPVRFHHSLVLPLLNFGPEFWDKLVELT